MKRLLIAIFVLFFFCLALADDIRPFKEVFIPSISQHEDGASTVTDIRVEIPEHFYLYADKTSVDKAQLPAGSTVKLSEPKEKHDEYFGQVQVYTPENPLHITITTPAPLPEVTVKTQGCEEGIICYPPDSFTLNPAAGGDVAVAQPAAKGFLQQQTAKVPAGSLEQNDAGNPVATTAQITDTNAGGTLSTGRLLDLLLNHYWLALPLVFLFGIAVSFTACIYPLVPIVTSLVAGKDTPALRANALIFVYVLGMSAAMAVLGAVFGLFQINLQALLQKPWIVVLVALFFALLALSMFDVYNIQTPRWLQKRTDSLSRQQKSGSFAGAAVMGALSILVVSPCATPALSVLLTAVTVTSPAKGALALFVFGFGTGLPLLLFASAFRRFMPKAGAWMTAVKRLIGFLMLGVALWLVVRLVPETAGWLAWAAFALAACISFDGSAQGSSGRLRFALRYAAGAAFLAAVFAVVQAAGHRQLAQNETAVYHAPFETVKTVEDLKTAIAGADKPVIVDFYADWCAACQVWEREIWQNPQFKAPLAGYRLVKIDMTDYTDNDKALMQALNLAGPPAVLFYDAGAAITAPKEKIIGELAPEAFAAYLR